MDISPGACTQLGYAVVDPLRRGTLSCRCLGRRFGGPVCHPDRSPRHEGSRPDNSNGYPAGAGSSRGSMMTAEIAAHARRKPVQFRRGRGSEGS